MKFIKEMQHRPSPLEKDKRMRPNKEQKVQECETKAQ